jgi:hypothetical protein
MNLPALSYCETWTRLRRAPPQMQPRPRGLAGLNGPRRFCSRPT